MNEKAILTNERFVRVFREEEELVSGKTIYVPDEVLTVQISDSTGQFVFESSHAEFIGGGCKKKNRVNKNHAVLKMPESGTVNVTIKAGWSMGHQEVHLTPSFLLVSPRQKKASIPGGHAKGDHHRAMGSTTLATLSKHLSKGIAAGVGLLHKGKDHRASSSHAKVPKVVKVKKGNSTDAEEENEAPHKRSSRKKGVKVEADFETMEEYEAEYEKTHKGEKRKKGHWRHAAKIIEKKLRGAMSDADEASPMWIAAAGFLLLVVVFGCYSCIRANRFRVSKVINKNLNRE